MIRNSLSNDRVFISEQGQIIACRVKVFVSMAGVCERAFVQYV